MESAARLLGTKRPADSQIVIPATSQIVRAMKRLGSPAAQIKVPAVIGIASAETASRICPRRTWRRRAAQIASPRARAKNLRSPPLRPDPCSNRSRKRARLPGGTDLLRCCPPDNNKRICSHRPAVNDVDPAVAGARTGLLPCCPLDNNNWRDWANLDDGPAGLIAERVLAYDVADYVRFRAVCRPWRQSCTEPRTLRGLDRRFHPWRWTMLREKLAEPDHRCFLNTYTGECVKVYIPELHDYEMLALTPEGLLVLARKPPRTTDMCLLNPFTRNLTQLPPLSTLVPSEYHDDMLPERNGLFLESDFRAWGSGIANDDSTVVLCFIQLNMLGMAKPGDDHWTMLEFDGGAMTAAPIMFEGHFYYVNRSGVMVLETGPPRLVLAAKLNKPVCVMADRFHLVNNCGELMLVHSGWRWGNISGRFYDTYCVDLDTGTLIPVKSLGLAGRALFLGQFCSLCVNLEVFPSASISADTIYLSFDMSERKLLVDGAYHLTDGSVEVPNSSVPDGIVEVPNSSVPLPHTLAECLSLASTIR